MIRFYDRKTRPGGGVGGRRWQSQRHKAHNKGEMEMNSEVFRVAKEAARSLAAKEISYKEAVDIISTFSDDTEKDTNEARIAAEQLLDEALVDIEESTWNMEQTREVVKETAARIYNREITYKRGVHCILRTFPETIEGLAERMLDAALLELEKGIYTEAKTQQAASEAGRQFTNDQLGYMDAVYYILTSLPPTRLRLFPISSEKYAEELLNEELSATNVNKE